ncbi:MAG: di/tricarboxylate transporter [Chlamydiales bacterium]
MQPYIVLATLVGSLLLFLTDLLRYEVVAILVVVVLALTGSLSPEDAFEGFSSPAVVVIASMYLFGHAFSRTGVAEAISNRFIKGHEGGEVGLMLRVTLLAGLLSSVLSNTGVVATLMPVCSSLARKFHVSVSRLMMPMAFGSMLGGLITVIATSTNIAVNQVVRAQGGTPFGLFDFSPLGLILLATGCLYFLGPGRLLLPRSPVDQSLTDRYQVPKFVTEILVEPSSTLINRAVADTDLFSRYKINVLGIIRSGGEGTVLAPGPYNRIRADDTLILQGAPDDILRLGKEMPLRQRRSVETENERLYSDDVRLVEALIPAGSPLVGSTLVKNDFRTRTGLNVLALAKSGRLQLKRIQDTVIEVGDTLLLQGHLRDIERVPREREVIVLEELNHVTTGRGAGIAVGLLAMMLLLATFSSIPLSVLALAGAAGLVLTKVVRAEEVPQVIDWAVIALVGGMLALGKAFVDHGWGETVASWFVHMGERGVSMQLVLASLLFATVALTQVLNNVSTAVIMTPVALELAQQLGVSDRPLLMAVVTGSSLAFMSPVSHQANAMVMGPGGYRYKHFVRVGAGLTLITAAVAIFLIPLFFPFNPPA